MLRDGHLPMPLHELPINPCCFHRNYLHLAFTLSLKWWVRLGLFHLHLIQTRLPFKCIETSISLFLI